MQEILLITMGGIVWLASAMWVATDARKHRISPVFWMLVTLVGGPLALADYRTAREVAISGRQLHNSGH
jgi:hypothetical protein